ncbi:MAG: DUF4091 domain-containing protein [Sedimentisphaerales bacterium]|nr:DUF4091 domain-containing protein [Sedimentisphaerales bacterium]
MKSCCVLILVTLFVLPLHARPNSPEGAALPQSDKQVALWWTSSGWKIKPDDEIPSRQGKTILIRTARKESEAAQLVIRPAEDRSDFTAEMEDLIGPDNAVLPASCFDLLRVRYVTTALPSDAGAETGIWPDPLPPLIKSMSIAADKNQPIWIRVTAPADAKAGSYHGYIRLIAKEYSARIPITVHIYDFSLPDRMTCTTAFGFSPGTVWQYQNIKDAKDKRTVLERYWANFSAHHISPYDPAPLDPFSVTWPKVSPPPSQPADWTNLRIVDNESHSGKAAMLLYDDDPGKDIVATYQPLIEIPASGLRFRCWYRTAVTGHRFDVSPEYFTEDRQKIPFSPNITVQGNGTWRKLDETVQDFPKGARYIRISASATQRTEHGEKIGLVWLDDISITNPETNEELLKNGDFETPTRTDLVLPVDQLTPKFDFTNWDKAITRAFETYHFNSFRVSIPGMGGGSYFALSQPSLLGFTENDPEHSLLFESYCKQLQNHLAEKGWLDKAYIYWFDEPSEDQYAFVKHGFDKLKHACPAIDRMITEQAEPALFDGPNIYCGMPNHYDHTVAEARRDKGDRFWWYICTVPKAPYCTEFVDHPGTELRVWLWQAWKWNIEGILVWQVNYWSSSTAYPDKPQNPYEDPMCWVSGYGVDPGVRMPWGNGDGRFIYPPEAAATPATEPVLEGPVDSIRWEMLRDGIEDYEYHVILKRLLADRKNKLDRARYEAYSALLEVPQNITTDLTHFTTTPAPIEKRRHAIARAIETLNSL